MAGGMIWLPENLFCKTPESIVNFDCCRLEQPKTLSCAAFALALVRLMKFAAPSFFCFLFVAADRRPTSPSGLRVSLSGLPLRSYLITRGLRVLAFLLRVEV